MLHMIRIGATQVYRDPLAAGINDVQNSSRRMTPPRRPRPKCCTGT
ncbi:hypothetical protein F8B43_3759 [Methylorubrum populi]|uniref:Uncharacterized protein n=1 Tax=Methylorubrum populi TaxID=223967 RepID=A0A833MY25_9HYPH|nr:hypothetical protein F8B43_3759 [Methylorubrum populi]